MIKKNEYEKRKKKEAEMLNRMLNKKKEACHINNRFIVIVEEGTLHHIQIILAFLLVRTSLHVNSSNTTSDTFKAKRKKKKWEM